MYAPRREERCAFLGYLAGIALADRRHDEARANSRGGERSPESIGGALARRERANLDAERST